MVVPNNLLPGWLQRAALAPSPVRVSFPERGYILLDPKRRRYASDIRDWSGASDLLADAAPMVPLAPEAGEPAGLPIDHLEWMVMLERLSTQPAADYAHRFGLARLNSWPCLTHVPEASIPVVARICALLARKPAAVSLIPLTLGLSEEQVFPLIEVLRHNQHILIAGGGSASTGTEKASATEMQEAKGAAPATNSLIGKIWQRLVMH